MRISPLRGVLSPSKRWKATGVFLFVHYFAGWWVMLTTPILLFFGVGWSLAYPLAWLMFGLFWMLWAPLAIALHLPHMSSNEVEMARVAGSLLYTALFYRFHAKLGQVWRWLGATLRKSLRFPIVDTGSEIHTHASVQHCASLHSPPGASMTAHRICTATDLEEGGLAVTFATPAGQPALAVRWQGKVFGYVNECAHASVPIDFERQVFDRSKTYLMCARHGAIYAPDTGLCVGGPCRGSSLDALAVRETDGVVWLDEASAAD